jgi:hypothetical protein
LVLHHQSIYELRMKELRMKYLPVLEKAFKDGKISQGWLDTYKWRNENIRLEKNENNKNVLDFGPLYTASVTDIAFA